ncbi:hypothetical protein Poli38472_001512 [Pythium oligandrum]|uniref:N-terminal acetyltransferase B complex subunit NAA25 homolog n=1 Tax=Pythium oligandrum TaxID=41045 RepID=A0A8K1CVG1_PYTOL|nr:hypothetical protein Poli38472_001512 [Pythium oligandrum]|eukprot:TMW69356.1 hypothetical protein Poli38472_001512 [Pythium oligandrum]
MADDFRVMNRFVRPIYDAIDGRQYKTAIKLCLHKKVAHLDIVQVLKAHCLERMGKSEEALEICRNVQKNKPTDETLLNTMYLVFRLCGYEHEMLPTYEYACAHTEPPNEELLMSLFGAYARKGDFLKQQQTALKMFKAFGKIKYMCWAALSMMLQVKHAGAPAKMLGLADRMLVKTMREAKSDDGEALQLLVHILQLQDKHDEALQVFDEFVPFMTDPQPADKKSSGGHCHDDHCSHSHSTKGRMAEGEGAYEEDIELGPMQAIDRLGLEASLSKTISKWERSAGVYKELLEKYNADDWTYLVEYIDVRFKTNSDVSALTTELMAYLTGLTEKDGNSHIRGPWLAKVHVTSKTLQHLRSEKASKDAIAKAETKFTDEIVAYAYRFYTKTCCFTDLKQYLLTICDAEVVSKGANESVVKFFTEMGDKAKVTSEPSKDESGRKDALNHLSRRLLSLKALRFLGVFTSGAYGIKDLEKLVQSLVYEYEANNWLNEGSKGGQREVQCTDDLLLLASHTLIDIYQRESTRRNALLEAASLLEYGLTKSAYNFQMKLVLSRVYGYLAAGEAMLSRHQELDVKHIQLDSLSFLVYDKLLQLCHHGEAHYLSDRIRRLHTSTNGDTPEYITRAYRLGVYSKVLDMTSFLHERMQNSHTLAIARGELLQFSIQEALSGGSSKLSELTSSQAFVDGVADLEKALQRGVDGLSQNQHRDVVVEWTQKSQVPSADSFSADGEPLTECDRSANIDTSFLWLKLQVVVPKILIRIAAGDAKAVDEMKALAAEYKELVSSLGLVSAEGSVKQQAWKWSVELVTLLGQITAVLFGDSAALQPLTEGLLALQQPLTEIRDGISASLTVSSSEQKLFSAYGLSAAALLFRDAGLWSATLLCALLRAWSKKRAKKDDTEGTACASALRTVLKQMQEVLTAVDTHVKALELSAPSDAVFSILPADHADLVAAHRGVLDNITTSHKTLQSHLSEQLRTAATSFRGMLQK